MGGRHSEGALAAPSQDTLNTRKKYHIPVRFLRDVHPGVDHDTAAPAHEEAGDDGPECPILVFINPKSGGKCGPLLQKLLLQALGELQVLDISQKESHPDVVLKALFANLEEAEGRGDAVAEHVRKRLRIVAAGGDGTVSWLLSTVRQLELKPPPPIGVIPLGTGNGMSVNFGWGKKTQPRDLKGRNKADKELEAIANAQIRPLDGWGLDIIAEDGSLIKELPHSVHETEGKEKEGLVGAGGAAARGSFWYYLTVGLDAEVAYRFHELRENKPWLSPTRKTNIFWYFYSTCRSGWFCCPTPLHKKMALRQRDGKTGEWAPVDIPKTVEAIIFINLQSYTGSRDMWGLHDEQLDKQRGDQVPIYDDGLIEVIGLESAGKSFLALTNLWKKIHGCRLAQGSEFELSLARESSSTGDDTHLRIDGEPWKQDLPDSRSAQQPLKVHIKVAPPARVLVNADNLPPKNKSTRAAADAAGTGKSGQSFRGDHQTVVADSPQPGAQPPTVQHTASKQSGMHLFTHHAE